MALTVRLGKAEIEKLRTGVVLESVLTKLEKAELLSGKKATRGGLPIKEAIEAFRGVLKHKLVLPPAAGAGWWAQMQRRLNDLGLTRTDCETLAKGALAKGWKGVRAELLIRNGDIYLAEAQLDLPLGKTTNAVVQEMDEL